MGGAIADYRKRGRRTEGQRDGPGRLLDVGCGCACLKTKKSQVVEKSTTWLLLFGRDYWTRTSDLAPPRRVRYQLR